MVDNKSTKVKSTRGKVAALKVEEPKPVSETQQSVESVEPVKPEGVNWDIFGISATALTLLGAGVLFMLGWAYEANWYGYFGVSITQINILPQQILIQSIPSTATILEMLIASVVIYIILVRTIFAQDPEEKRPVTRSFTWADWLPILFISTLLNILVLISRYVTEFVFQYDIKIDEVYEVSYVIMLLVVPLAAFIFLDLFFKSILKFQKRLINFKLPTIIAPSTNLILVALVFMHVLFGIGHSAFIGIYDASHGKRGSGGWSIQPFILSSPEIKGVSDILKISCVKKQCEYGPLGLIGESDTTYILVNEKERQGDLYTHQSGIYVIPKSENVYLIPYDISIYSSPSQTIPTPTATKIVPLTIAPSVTSTISPTQTPSLTVTSTP